MTPSFVASLSPPDLKNEPNKHMISVLFRMQNIFTEVDMAL